MSADRSKKGLRGAFLLLAAAVVAGIGISAQKRDTTPIRPSIPQADRPAPNRVFLERAPELRTD
ncbi:MAG: hypothetical protein K2O33_07570, partial [Muribaculaceae bacterium]|nr:hypothetical protein [Muribaculaceae bacterium]